MPLSVALTVVFVLTGAYALVRWASVRTGVGHPGDPVAELSHVLMSLGMLAMVWAYGGSVLDTVQLIVFTGFAGYFLVHLVRGRARRPGAHRCAGAGLHLVMAAAMVWMIASMPWLMGGGGSGSTGGRHADHSGAAMPDMPGMSGTAGSGTHGMAAAPPARVVALTVLLASALVVVAAVWLARAARGVPGHPAGDGRADRAADRTAAAAGATEGGVGLAVRPAAGPPAALSTRTDAVCHLAMSLGMAAMLLAML
ncbi:MAG TPA: DUF5134 domain-containing protein [Pseudonocardia sp.]